MMAPVDSVPILLEVFWKSGVVLGGVLCLNGLLRKKSADVRRLVLSTAVVAILVSAAALPILPRWTAFAPLSNSSSPSVTGQSPASAGIYARLDFATRPIGSAQRGVPERTLDLMPSLIPFIWIAGAAALLTRFAINLRALRRLGKRSDAVTDANVLAGVARFGSRVRLRRSESIAAPVTWGIFRPIILVPAGFEELPAETRDAVLCHEFAHIQGGDFLMRLLAETARALIWFQPLIWIVRRQLREEQELACDNRVLASGGKPSAYAKLLLDWDTGPGMDSLIALGMTHRSCLKRRLYALLDPNVRRDTVGGAIAACTWVGGLATALALAALGFAQAIPTPRAITTSTPPVQVAQAQSTPAAVAAPQVAVAPAPALRPKFDSASIQPCQPGDGPGRSGRGDMGANGGVDPKAPEGVGGYFRATPGRLDVTCGSVLTMIMVAYIDNGTPLLNNPGALLHPAQQILELPKWALAPRYTIHAVSGDPAANGQTDGGPGSGILPTARLLYGPMLQGLLEDRFQLQTHREVEEAPMYALTAAKTGFKLTTMQDGECTPLTPGQMMRMIGADDKPYCGWVGWPIHGPNHTLLGGGITMERLAGSLAMFVLDRNVIDRTGIAGSFLVRLEYTPDENTRCFGGPEICKVDPNSDIPAAVTIFSALEQQLGLTLERIKGPKEHIVIDRVERPSEN
jgi:bla regulator protein blaR1